MLPFLINSQPTSNTYFEFCNITCNRQEYQTLHLPCTNKLYQIQAINSDSSEQLIILTDAGNAMKSFKEQHLKCNIKT